MICDSDGDKESLNGTWILIDENTTIEENMYVRFCSSTIKFNFK